MKNCPYCGSLLPDSAMFCGYCGKKLDAAENAPGKSAHGTSGLSYGWPMPQEENEYNYPGDWRDYFRSIFQEEFPEYKVTEKETAAPYALSNRDEYQYLGSVQVPPLSFYPSFNQANMNILNEVFTFTKNGAVCLVVEVRTGESALRSKQIRNSCSDIGVPFVRFYYDHVGWWNTRSYVKEKITAALLP